MCIIVGEDISFLLVEEVNTLLSMAQENILGVDDNFITGIGSFNSRIDLEDSILPIPKDDLFLVITSFISLLKTNIFWIKVHIIAYMNKNVDA